MSQLARPDLNQVAFASDSFLGRVIGLGQEYEKLPDNVADVLMAYLRAKGMAFAQRYRSGIALGRDRLERGVRQSLVCLEIGIEDRAAGDVNAAVDLLAQGEFEALRQRGWELAFDEVAHWARIVPETWMGEGETGQEQLVDPLRDYAAFVDLRDQVRFMQTLPRQELRKLLRQVPRGGSFAAILRNLIAALALDQQALVATPESVEQFQRQCFVDGRMVQDVREKVLDLAGQHLTEAVADAEMRQRIVAAIAVEIGELERASAAHI